MLKTAEELKIKGLAEVSWRSDEQQKNSDISFDDSHISKKRKLDSSPTNIKKDNVEKQVNISIFLMYNIHIIYIHILQENDMELTNIEESDPNPSIWEPEMQHVDIENAEIEKQTVSNLNMIFA